LSSPSPDLIRGLTGRPSNHHAFGMRQGRHDRGHPWSRFLTTVRPCPCPRPGLLDRPVKPGDDYGTAFRESAFQGAKGHAHEPARPIISRPVHPVSGLPWPGRAPKYIRYGAAAGGTAPVPPPLRLK
jgi:hypothetical protein